MNDVHTMSNKLTIILYAHEMTLTGSLYSFTYGGYSDIKSVSTSTNSEITRVLN